MAAMVAQNGHGNQLIKSAGLPSDIAGGSPLSCVRFWTLRDRRSSYGRWRHWSDRAIAGTVTRKRAIRVDAQRSRCCHSKQVKMSKQMGPRCLRAVPDRWLTIPPSASAEAGSPDWRMGLAILHPSEFPTALYGGTSGTATLG